MFCLSFPYLPSPRSIWWSTFQNDRELITKVKILKMSMTESTQWTLEKCIFANIARKIVLKIVTVTNEVDGNGHSKHFNFENHNQPGQPASRPAQFPSNSFAQFQRLVFESSSKNAFCQWMKSCLPLFSCCTRRRRLRRRRTSLSNCFQRRRDWIEKWAWRKRVSTLKEPKHFINKN